MIVALNADMGHYPLMNTILSRSCAHPETCMMRMNAILDPVKYSLYCSKCDDWRNVYADDMDDRGQDCEWCGESYCSFHYDRHECKGHKPMEKEEFLKIYGQGYAYIFED